MNTSGLLDQSPCQKPTHLSKFTTLPVSAQKEETRFLRSLLDLEGTTRINAELAEALIESMYLYGDGRLEINFRFKGAIEHE